MPIQKNLARLLNLSEKFMSGGQSLHIWGLSNLLPRFFISISWAKIKNFHLRWPTRLTIFLIQSVRKFSKQFPLNGFSTTCLKKILFSIFLFFIGGERARRLPSHIKIISCAKMSMLLSCLFSRKLLRIG